MHTFAMLLTDKQAFNAKFVGMLMMYRVRHRSERLLEQLFTEPLGWGGQRNVFARVGSPRRRRVQKVITLVYFKVIYFL